MSTSQCVYHFISRLALRGEVMNGGFGLLLDGSEEASKRARLMLNWDVSNGVGVLRGQQHDRVQPHLLSMCSNGSPICSYVLQVARRCWSGNSKAYETIQHTMEENGQLRVTMPFSVQDECVLDRALQG